MKITLTGPKSVVTVPQQTQTVSTLTIRQMMDNPVAQTVTVFVQEFSAPIVLWSATSTPTYAAIGDWTNAQVEARLLQLYSA